VAISSHIALPAPAVFDVKEFGARGDGRTQERDSINRAIDAAAASGGGTVYFPAGVYVSGSIRLRSNITLQLERGAMIEASSEAAQYDTAEPNAFDKYQDFGHSHWHNSLIRGRESEQHSYHGRRPHQRQSVNTRPRRRG
jgi:polygalacturonase